MIEPNQQNHAELMELQSLYKQMQEFSAQAAELSMKSEYLKIQILERSKNLLANVNEDFMITLAANTFIYGCR